MTTGEVVGHRWVGHDENDDTPAGTVGPHYLSLCAADVVDEPVDIDRRLFRGRIAVVLRDDLPAGSPLSVVGAAIGGVVLVAEFPAATDTTDCRLILGDQLLDPVGNPVLRAVTGSGRSTTWAVRGGPRLTAELAALAAALGGLPAGSIVLPAPVRAERALVPGPGIAEVRGPLDAVLSVRIAS